jgi:hypothetical protein
MGEYHKYKYKNCQNALPRGGGASLITMWFQSSGYQNLRYMISSQGFFI